MADELKTLRQVLRQAARASHESTKDLETALGLGHGNLERLLDGSLELRVRHLVAMAKVLDVPPADFLELGLPEVHRSARHHLADWIGRPPLRAAAAEPAAAALPVSQDDLLQMIRAAVQEALDARDAGARPADVRRRK
jgi:Cro/C1-type helix-turn-helix DNA-binding protein